MSKLAIHGGKPVRDTPLHYARQYIDQADILAVTDTLKRFSYYRTKGAGTGRAVTGGY